MAHALDFATLVGQHLDHYRILEVLGRGGMGTVLRAEDLRLGRPVALKVIHPSLAENDAFRERFRREAHALAQFTHQHIVIIYSIHETETAFYITMEYVEGQTLTDLLRGQGPLAWQEALHVMEQTLDGIGYAHNKGVIHRDLKPNNLMLTTEGIVKVMDFGLSKLQHAPRDVTMAGTVAGTLYYMSPEQIQDLRSVDQRSDVFSLGLTFYEMLAGRLPFERELGDFEIMRAIIEAPFPPVHTFAPEIPPDLSDALMKALAKDPAERYQNAVAMQQAFASFLDQATSIDIPSIIASPTTQADHPADTMVSPSAPPDTFPFGQPIVWEPNPDWIARSNLRRFMDRHGIASYDDLLKQATDDIAWFWDAALKDLGIAFYTPYEQVVDLSNGPAFPEWCVGGAMNIIHNALDKWQATPTRDRDALRWEGEDGTTRTLTYAGLYAEVNRCANALRRLGLGKGDAVGLYMPMTPELCIAFLAVIKIGGIILPLFSGYGPAAIATRLNDAGAKALFTADGFTRRGKPIAMKATADEALASCPTVQHVIVQHHADVEVTMQDGRDHWWHELVPNQPADAATERTSAEDVLMIIYTSGTTGRPKGAVHTHCGFPIKGTQDMYHSMDLKPGECMYWMTDMGWMMGPWLVFGTLCIGATMVFYDGAPDYPGPDRVWQLCEDHKVTHLGLSPVLIRALRTHGPGPIAQHDLSRLRTVGSTGSPWDPSSWQWCFEHVLQRKKPILNYSGGTEISGGILCGNVFTPLKPCAFSGPVPGMDADVVDPDGRPVREEVGELVIRQPWIGMTRGFWNDRERYLDTYWRRFEGLWLHGDFAAIDRDGLWYILGRSDDTIKVAGKRLGPAEVEALLNAHPAVAESAAVGVPDPVKGETLVVFAVLTDPEAASEDLRSDLIARITTELGKPLQPKALLFTRALPKTRNAKIMRRVIRATYLGDNPGDVSSLEDPATVEAIQDAR